MGAEQGQAAAKATPAPQSAPTRPSTPQSATTAPAPAAVVPTTPGAAAATNYVGLSYQQLRAIRDELSSQRQTLANRRGAIASSYEGATGANREGIGARLTVLDNNIITLENQIADVGARMANAKPSTGTLGANGNGWTSDKVANFGFSIFLATALVTAYVMRRFARRRMLRTPATPALGPAASNERLERIEQAVDTIAVEIERVSENQRFMTRLMTETQLAGTIAAVRSSAEAAKSEVDSAAPR
jgi:hypothetical protein